MSASFQLFRRIYKGVPLQLRGEVWCLLLDIPRMKEEKKDYYEVRASGCGGRALEGADAFLPFSNLLQKLKATARGQSPDIRQIDLDVNRTYRDHIMFRNRYDVK